MLTFLMYVAHPWKNYIIIMLTEGAGDLLQKSDERLIMYKNINISGSTVRTMYAPLVCVSHILLLSVYTWHSSY